MTDKPSKTSTSHDPTNVPISAAGYCLPWEPLVYALDRIVDLGHIHGPGRAVAEARYGRVAAVLVKYPGLADEAESLRAENEALRKELEARNG